MNHTLLNEIQQTNSMKQFKNKSLIIMFYEILGYCIANKQLPKRIDFYVEDNEEPLHVCNMNYYPNRETNDLQMPEETSLIKERIPDELTEAERAYAEHLKRNQKENLGRTIEMGE